MSWLKSTISRVGERAGDLREKASVGLKSATEKTKEAVSQAKDVAKLRIGKANNAAELEAQLEYRAQNAKKVEQLAELHKSWVQSITGSKDKYRQEEGEPELSFRQVLLRSRALEMSLEVLALDPEIRKHYAQAPAEDDQVSPAFQLYSLLGNCISCSVSLWSGVISMMMGNDELMSNNHVQWFVGIIGAIKMDWRDELYHTERKEMAMRAEQLRQEIRQIKTGGSEGAEEDEKHKQKVAASAELVRTYSSLKSNMEDAVTHRKEFLSHQERELNLISEAINGYVDSLQSSANASSERHDHLQAELKSSHDSIQLQLKTMDETRATIDKEIETLEQRRLELKMELDKCCAELDQARDEQRKHMAKVDKHRSELDNLKVGFKQKIQAETSVADEADKQKNLTERVMQLVRDTDAVVQSALGTQIDELTKKQQQFDIHFKEILEEHLNYEEAQAQVLVTDVETCVASVKAKRQEQEILTAMDASVKHVLEVEERAKVAKTIAAVEKATADFASFQSDYGQFLTETATQRVTRLEGQHQQMQQALTPCVELLQASPPVPTPTAVGMPETQAAQGFAPPPRTPEAPQQTLSSSAPGGGALLATTPAVQVAESAPSSGMPPPAAAPLPTPGSSGMPPPAAAPLPTPGSSGMPPPAAAPLPTPGSSGMPPPAAAPLPTPGSSGMPPPAAAPLPTPGSSGMPPPAAATAPVAAAAGTPTTEPALASTSPAQPPAAQGAAPGGYASGQVPVPTPAIAGNTALSEGSVSEEAAVPKHTRPIV